MTQRSHYQCLENMYLNAPINEFYRPKISIQKAKSEIIIEIREDFFHAAKGVHGSVYFKMLDDAAFFAANSLVEEVFVLTANFTTYLTLPVNSGHIRAVGNVLDTPGSQFICTATAYDDQQRMLAYGSGTFVRSKLKLADTTGYS